MGGGILCGVFKFRGGLGRRGEYRGEGVVGSIGIRFSKILW